MSAGALGAPVVAPIIGGLFAAYLSWRYSFLLEALIATFNFLLFLYILPETISAASKHRSFNILLPYKTVRFCVTSFLLLFCKLNSSIPAFFASESHLYRFGSLFIHCAIGSFEFC